MIEPLRVSFDVECSVEHAFATWTERISSWWPAAHTVTHAPGLRVVLEPGVGGRILERTPDGDEVTWGEVTAWDPPRRLGYLWHIGADRADATDVEIAFTRVGASRTRVDILHGGWDRLPADAGPARREANRHGWDGVIPVFVAACAA